MLEFGQLPLAELGPSTLCSLMACLRTPGRLPSSQTFADWDGYRTRASHMWRFSTAALEAVGAAGAAGIVSPPFAADGCDWNLAAFIIDEGLYLGLKCTPHRGAPADW